MGIHYTPHEIVDYLMQRVFEYLLSERENLRGVRILDPSCGCGAFLVPAARLLIQSQETHRKANLSTQERLNLLRDAIFGFDLDSQAVEWACRCLLLAVWQDAGIGAEATEGGNSERFAGEDYLGGEFAGFGVGFQVLGDVHPTDAFVRGADDEVDGVGLGLPIFGVMSFFDTEYFLAICLAFGEVGVAGLDLQIDAFAGGFAFVVFEFDFGVDSVVGAVVFTIDLVRFSGDGFGVGFTELTAGFGTDGGFNLRDNLGRCHSGSDGRGLDLNGVNERNFEIAIETRNDTFVCLATLFDGFLIDHSTVTA